ncbi:hypothetical protein PR001_g5036 [Phytophthora rubi]|uniref:Uncharacterized protein n=1 Tax=Phytophthora rubi TaxID=129364 RepID=A0A6A3NIC1_9STRA|nr:hypothetical protein PR001_g5036 [Phytophthora rubi]
MKPSSEAVTTNDPDPMLLKTFLGDKLVLEMLHCHPSIGRLYSNFGRVNIDNCNFIIFFYVETSAELFAWILSCSDAVVHHTVATKKKAGSCDNCYMKYRRPAQPRRGSDAAARHLGVPRATQEAQYSVHFTHHGVDLAAD